MDLFGSTTSFFVRHCRIALEQAQLPYTFTQIDYATSAKDSPTQKMPYLKDGDLTLTDSSSILMYVRQKQEQDFPASLADYEIYTTATTIADTAVNLFLLEKDGITPENSSYLQRQKNRLSTGFEALNNLITPNECLNTDGHIRAACLVDWVLFRERLDIGRYNRLIDLVSQASLNDIFQKTNPRT